MSRNHTRYSIVRYSNDEPPELSFYADCRTAKQARRIAAANPGSVIKRWHYTPSSHKGLWSKRDRATRELLTLQRCYRNLRRREADAKKKEMRWGANLIVFFDGRAIQRMGVFAYIRYLSGVRKGTIL